MPRRRLAFMALICAVVFPPAAEGFAPQHAQHLALDSGTHSNPAASEAVVFTQRIDGGDAAWVRLAFGPAELPDGSYLRITSELDGAVQTLDAGELREWQSSSAFFNGPVVRFEIVAGPRSTGVGCTIDSAVFGGPGGDIATLEPPAVESVCGVDGRTHSNNPAAARLVSATTGADIRVCSAFLIDLNPDHDPRNFALLSAGHCWGAPAVTIAQFNVPRSNNDCTLKHPDPADQFPIQSQQTRDLGVAGEDWAVLSCGRSDRKTAHERQQALYRLTTPLTQAARKFGFGAAGVAAPCTCKAVDNATAPNISNHTQQKVSGTITGVVTLGSGAIRVDHNLDTCGGDSGCPIVMTSDTTAAVAIQTHGICSGNVNVSQGTSIETPLLVTAMQKCKNHLWNWAGLQLGRPMYDYDQKQLNWGKNCPVNPNVTTFTWCGPVALANAMHWLDTYVHAGLVPIQYRTPPNANSPVDPVKLIDGIARTARDGGVQNEPPGCAGLPHGRLQEMASDFVDSYAPNQFGTRIVPADDFGAILTEASRPDQAVVALLGFYQIVPMTGQVARTGGHYVTLSGAGLHFTLQRLIGMSDPYWDTNAVGLGMGRFVGPHGDTRSQPVGVPASHNGGDFTHDVFAIAPGPAPFRVEGYDAAMQDPFSGQNGPPAGLNINAPGTYIEWVMGVYKKTPAEAGDTLPTSSSLAVVANPASSGPVLVRYTVTRPVNDVRLGIYDVAGRLVQEIDHSSVPAGSYVRSWDRRDAVGSHVARGVYVVRLTVGADVVLRKIVLLSE